MKSATISKVFSKRKKQKQKGENKNEKISK